MAVIKKDEGPSQQEFINDLMDSLGKKDSKEEASTPTTEVPAVEEEETPTTEAPTVAEEEPAEEPTTEAPEAEEEEEYEEVVELSKSGFDALLKKLDDLGKKVQEQPGATPTSEVVAKAAKPSGDGGVKLSVPDLKKALLSEDELDLVADEPQVINKAFERLLEAITPTFEALSNLPGTIESQVNNLLSVKDVVVGFYQENPDIAGNETVQQLVQMEFDKRAAVLAQSGQSVNEKVLLNEIADKVRKDLGWDKPKVAAKGGKTSENKKVTVLGEELDAVVRRRKKAKGKPTLPGGGGGRKPATPKKDRAGEAGKIDELLSELGAIQ